MISIFSPPIQVGTLQFPWGTHEHIVKRGSFKAAGAAPALTVRFSFVVVVIRFPQL
jgi:hypothetical protein